MRCSCGGEVDWVLTQTFDEGDILALECLECGADFSDPDEETIIENGEIRTMKRWPTPLMTPSPSAE
jgi:hypothetical protein